MGLVIHVVGRDPPYRLSIFSRTDLHFGRAGGARFETGTATKIVDAHSVHVHATNSHAVRTHVVHVHAVCALPPRTPTSSIMGAHFIHAHTVHVHSVQNEFNV